MLTAKQQEFLEARKLVGNDITAYEQVGIARTTLYRWKKDSAFLEEYNAVIGALVIGAEDRTALAVQQVDALVQVLPEVVQRHIYLALGAEKEETQLKAILEVYKVIGFGGEGLLPPGKYNKVLIQVLNLMGPQVAAEAKRRGLSIENVIEASVMQLPAGEERDADVGG